MDCDVARIFRLFFDEVPADTRLINTSRGDADFRMACIVETETGGRYVLKLAAPTEFRDCMGRQADPHFVNSLKRQEI